MSYQIAYYSRTGNSRTLACGVAENLPPNTLPLLDLSQQDVEEEADAYVLCFGMTKGEIPIQIMDVLEYLDGKDLLFLVTCGMEVTEEYRSHIIRKLEPFLPDNSECLGLFLCNGAFPDALREHAEATLQENPESKKAAAVLRNWKQAFEHPDQDDIADATQFVMEHLQL